jgi:hypothetical protein
VLFLRVADAARVREHEAAHHDQLHAHGARGEIGSSHHAYILGGAPGLFPTAGALIYASACMPVCLFACAANQWYCFCVLQCLGAKIDHIVHLSETALADGKCVVIGLQTTGEAKSDDYMDNHTWDGKSIVSNAGMHFERVPVCSITVRPA